MENPINSFEEWSKVEIHPNTNLEVGYYDISGKDNFRLYICKKPNFLQRFMIKFLLG